MPKKNVNLCLQFNYNVLLTQTHSSTKQRSLVERILPLEWDLQFIDWDFRFQRAQVVVVSGNCNENILNVIY